MMNGERLETYSRRVLLTGGAGFIGSHTLTHFVENYPDYYVVNIDTMDYCASLNNINSLENRPNYKFIEGDICDIGCIRRIFQEYQIDTVIHLAAKSHVDLSFNNSMDFTMTNVVGTNVLLIVAREFNIKRFLHISTDEVYGGTKNMKVDEKCLMNPTNPYSGTKAAAECIVMSYFNAFKMPVVTVRCNNVYGPQQFPEKVIPKFISLLQRNRKCFIHGPGSVSRSFMYVSDAVAAFDRVFHEGAVGEIYNIGTEFEISILELAKDLITRITGDTREEDIANKLTFVHDRPFNDDSYRLCWDKICKLGWKPIVPWDVGIKKTIDWFRDHNAPGSRHWDNSENVLTAFPQFDYSHTDPKLSTTCHNGV